MRIKAWGAVIAEECLEVKQRLRFQGQYDDAETGLYYNRYRYYDPNSARYVSQDFVGLLGGLNQYAYAANPIAWTDPLGLKKSCTKNLICNPCDGRDPAALARAQQGTRAYPGVDSYRNVILKKGTVVFGGVPGQTAFYMDGKTALGAGGSANTLGERLQIQPHEIFGHRKKIQGYIIKNDTCAAIGQATAQPIDTHGEGGGTQMFIPEYRTVLQPSHIVKLTRT